MTIPPISAWLLLMFPLVYSPGPANTVFASNGALFGFRRSLPLMAGIDVSFVLQSLLVGFGLYHLFAQRPLLLPMLKVVGIAYIAYLALTFVQASHAKELKEAECMNFRDGFILTFLNPKAWVTQAMMFSQFMDPSLGAVRVLQLTLMLSALNITGHLVWIKFGELVLGQASSVLTPRTQNLCFAGMLLLSIGFMV